MNCSKIIRIFLISCSIWSFIFYLGNWSSSWNEKEDVTKSNLSIKKLPFGQTLTKMTRGSQWRIVMYMSDPISFGWLIKWTCCLPSYGVATLRLAGVRWGNLVTLAGELTVRLQAQSLCKEGSLPERRAVRQQRHMMRSLLGTSIAENPMHSSGFYPSQPGVVLPSVDCVKPPHEFQCLVGTSLVYSSWKSNC